MSKYMPFKSNIHKEIDKCRYIFLSLKDVDINDVDEAFYLYLFDHNRKFDFYCVKWQFNLIFIDYQYGTYVTFNLSESKTKISGSIYLQKINSDFEDEGYNFNQIAEMHILTIANKLDMSYDFFIKYNIHAVEWKLNAMINKDKILIKKIQS